MDISDPWLLYCYLSLSLSLPSENNESFYSSLGPLQFFLLFSRKNKVQGTKINIGRYASFLIDVAGGM